MRNTLLALLLLTAPALADVSFDLVQSELEIVKAIETKDAAAFNALTWPEGFFVDGLGFTLNKDLTAAFSDMTVEWMKASEIKVVPVTADSMVVVYRLDQKGAYKGQAFPPTVWCSTTWVKRDGKWLAAWHQESAATP